MENKPQVKNEKVPNPFEVLTSHVMTTLPDSVAARLRILRALFACGRSSATKDQVKASLFTLEQHQRLIESQQQNPNTTTK